MENFENMLRFIIFFCFLSIATSCMSSKNVFDRIEYRFQDASVPPMFHRSYTIDVDFVSKSIKTDVDVYNTPLANDTRPLQEEEWKKLQTLAEKLEKAGVKTAKTATGTQTYIIRLHHAGKAVYEFIWDSMNEASADTEAFVEAVRALVPNLETLKATEYKPK